jgi:hypothetical protein
MLITLVSAWTWITECDKIRVGKRRKM